MGGIREVLEAHVIFPKVVDEVFTPEGS